MAKYIISINRGEECNPEYGPDKEMENMGVDGFFVVGFRNQKPFFESMMGCSISDLSKWIMNRSPVAKPIRAACAIANGEIAAEKILEENRVPDFGTLTGTTDVSEDMIRKILGKDEKEQEVVEPKTGHWIFESAYCEAWSHTCSECGKRMTTAYNTYANYCWNCGAKMEQEGR